MDINNGSILEPNYPIGTVFCIVVTDYFRIEPTRTVKECVGLLGGKAVTTFFAGKLMLLVQLSQNIPASIEVTALLANRQLGFSRYIRRNVPFVLGRRPQGYPTKY